MRFQRGFSLVELLIAVIIIAVIAAIAIPSLLASRRAANEASAVQSLRAIVSAEAAYLRTLGAGANYGTLNQLNAAGMVDDLFVGASFTKSGYTFNHSLTATPNSFCADSIPNGGGGIRVFGVDQSGAIWQGLTAASPCTNGILDTTGGTGL